MRGEILTEQAGRGGGASKLEGGAGPEARALEGTVLILTRDTGRVESGTATSRGQVGESLGWVSEQGRDIKSFAAPVPEVEAPRLPGQGWCRQVGAAHLDLWGSWLGVAED